MNKKYVTRLALAYKSFRTKVFTFITALLTFISVDPEKAKILIGDIIGQDFVTNHWQTLIILVSLISTTFFAHGAARFESSVPLEER